MRDVSTICAGIVTYNPKLDLLEENLHALLPQVDKVLIVDNCSDNVSNIEVLVEESPKTYIIKNKSNSGIAKALNQLCSEASRMGYLWILTMDQDSICQPDMVAQLLFFADSEKYGIIAPRVEFWDEGQLIYSTKDGDKPTVEVDACITSGSLTNIRAWEKVNGFDEWFFIDHVDNEFCTHLKVCGYHILRVNKAVLRQRAGFMKHVSVPFFGKLLLPYYNEQRNYYICRNTVYFIRKYHADIDLVHQVGAFIYSQLVKLVFEPHRWATTRSTVKGVFHGFKKKIES